MSKGPRAVLDGVQVSNLNDRLATKQPLRACLPSLLRVHVKDVCHIQP